MLQLLFLFISLCQVIDCGAGTYQGVNYNDSCSFWKYDKYQNSSCECGDRIHGVVTCRNDQSTVYLLTCHCMSYSDHGDMILVGACVYHCTNQFYMKVTKHANLNDLCNSDVQQNREGQMCGKCVHCLLYTSDAADE